MEQSQSFQKKLNKEKLNKNISHVPRVTYCDNMLCVDEHPNEL